MVTPTINKRMPGVGYRSDKAKQQSPKINPIIRKKLYIEMVSAQFNYIYTSREDRKIKNTLEIIIDNNMSIGARRMVRYID